MNIGIAFVRSHGNDAGLRKISSDCCDGLGSRCPFQSEINKGHIGTVCAKHRHSLFSRRCTSNVEHIRFSLEHRSDTG